jgi:hypothetical protein
MSAVPYPLLIEQGSTVNFEIRYTDSSGNPVDLTDYEGKMQFKSGYADTNPTIYLTLSSSREPDGTGLNFNGLDGTTPTTSGSIGVYISSCTSSLLTFDVAYYDLEIYSGSNCPFTIRLMQGQVKISKEVTR